MKFDKKSKKWKTARLSRTVDEKHTIKVYDLNHNLKHKTLEFLGFANGDPGPYLLSTFETLMKWTKNWAK